jgi:glycosyltransferase involved in cell wall biosynthesis
LIQIHQLLPNLDYGDAISNHALELRNILRQWGYQSNIYAQYIHPRMSKECFYYQEHKTVSSPRNIAIYHYSIGAEIQNYVKNIPDKKIMIYHNITPHFYFEDFNPRLTQLLREGREGLRDFLYVPLLCLAVSEYNLQELKALGYKRVAVLPIIHDFSKFQRHPNISILDRYSDGVTNILYVGRVVPNKKHEDLIKTFYFYHKYINPNSRLLLVGSYQGMEQYFFALQNLIERLSLDQIIFTGRVDLADLIAYYRTSQIFLSLSEHEGFGVPFLEAMFFKLPIVAFKSTGVPYTLGDAGILVREKQYEELAELIALILSDGDLRNKIIEKQSLRLKDFSKEKILSLFKGYIEDVIKTG